MMKPVQFSGIYRLNFKDVGTPAAADASEAATTHPDSLNNLLTNLLRQKLQEDGRQVDTLSIDGQRYLVEDDKNGTHYSKVKALMDKLHRPRGGCIPGPDGSFWPKETDEQVAEREAALKAYQDFPKDHEADVRGMDVEFEALGTDLPFYKTYRFYNLNVSG